MNEPLPIRPRPVLSQLPAYAAGKPAAPVEGLTPYKLSSNENPFGPVPAVRAVLERFTDICRYPDPLSTALRERLGEHLQISPQDIVTGAGSLGALTQIITTYAGTHPDGTQDEVIYAWRSFEAYPIVVRAAGARDVQVPLTADFRHDLDAMAAAITERTRVIIVCTPNNPTGPALTGAEVEAFLAKVPPDVLVVLDEAYTEFITQPDAVDALEVYRRHANVAVLRTFSKAHGLANLRVGYSVSHPHVTQYLRVLATPFAVSSVAEQAAIASLDHIDEVNERVAKVVSERERVLTGLAALGWDVPDSQGNLVWLPLGDRTPEFLEAAGRQALAVRGFGTEGVRVTIGEEEANTRFLQLCADFPERPTPAA
ncbi:histidinol-phosphate transaminase [Citricoccus alkalitolerans]|uniref:Aromatic amino acid aminotransferase n=1 Tax=Citricoccus alkalitolerans TaxID=246603 RepID=A0ABV8XYN4_9MICC